MGSKWLIVTVGVKCVIVTESQVFNSHRGRQVVNSHCGWQVFDNHHRRQMVNSHCGWQVFDNHHRRQVVNSHGKQVVNSHCRCLT